MKKKFLKYLFLLTISICAVLIIAVSWFLYNFYRNNQIESIKSFCIITSQLIDSDSSLEYLENIDSSDMRITLIDSDGSAVFDTATNSSSLKSFLQEPEIINANETGTGESSQYSSVLKSNVFVYVIKLNNNMLLRVETPLKGIYQNIAATVPLILLILLVFALISNFIAKLLTHRIIEPINKASKQLDGVLTQDQLDFEELDAYEEFLPFIKKIKFLNHEIRDYARQIDEQSHTLNTITSNMQEGLLILDSQQRIISINESAKSVISYGYTRKFTGQTFISVCRNQRILEAINKVINTKTNNFIDIEKNKQFYKFFLSPVISENNNFQGVIIFIVNATAEIKNSKMRRDFASNVSHELKTPLTSINGFAEMLKSSMIDEKDIIKISSMIYKESGRLISLVDDIIRLSQIENGALIDTQDVDFENIVNEVVSSLTPIAENRKITFALNTKPLIIKSSYSMLYELVYNLCENAIKYNVENGSINVVLKSSDKEAILSVTDTGIGIAEEHLSRIFERFYRVDKSRSKQTGGTGLGLSIVKHVVESLNGNISITSEPGKGTAITVTLPKQN